MFEENNRVLEEWTAQLPPDQQAEYDKLTDQVSRVMFMEGMYNGTLDLFSRIPLWEPGKAPEMLPDNPQREPSLLFFPAEHARGCVIICPGGAYWMKAIQQEGFPLALKLVKSGYSAAILDYRTRPYTQYVSLMDIQRAIRVLRSRAEELGIDPGHIAVNGSSAGGHLCSMAAVHYDAGKDSPDPIERVSCRPDAVILSYGLFSVIGFPSGDGLCKFEQDSDRTGAALLCPYQDSQAVRRHRVFFSPEMNVTPDTPPFFFWQTCDDDDPRQLFRFAKQLTENGVRFEAHIYPYGPHGQSTWDGYQGLIGNDPHVASWFRLAVEWMDREFGFGPAGAAE